MEIKSIVVDDFYINPLGVREQALSLEFDVTGNYPGARTASFLNDSIKGIIQELLAPYSGKIDWMDWNDPGYCGSYQMTYENDVSWIHADYYSTWAGICYLTPDAPHTGGTGFFKHKKTGLSIAPFHDKELMSEVEGDGNNHDKWEMTDKISNKFNRLILYRGNYFHQSLDYFGNSLKTARLFQVFFFNTEY